MIAKYVAFTAALTTVVAVSPAQARPASKQRAAQSWQQPSADWVSTVFASNEARPARAQRSSQRSSLGVFDTGGRYKVGPRPGKWCGWYMRTRHGGGPAMNRAWNWRHYGRPAEPQIGAIVVWRHHVGEIVGRAPNGQWIILSGNDSHRVRQRPRSIAGTVVRM